MFHHTYQTTACSSYSLRELQLALERARINGELTAATTSAGASTRAVLQVTPYSKVIPAFHHPIALKDADDRNIVVVDQRPNMGMDRNGVTRISQKTQYDFATLRGALEWLWNNGYRDELSVVGQLPFKTYARMMSENIRRRLGLDPTEQQTLVALAGYYYQCQFMEVTELTDAERMKMAVRIRNNTMVPIEVSLPVIEQLPVLTDLASFCDAVKQIIHNPRVNTLSPAFIITVNMGQWFGGNAKETTAVALEYPPAFIAMVYTAINDRGMYTAPFAKLVDSIAKTALVTEFNMSMRACLEVVTNV